MTYPALAEVLAVIGTLSGISGAAPGIVNFVCDQPKAAYAASLSAAGTGRISGTVVDEHGVPTANFVVQVYPIGVTIIGTIPRIKTDEHGHFAITVSASDRWLVYPRQEKDYYPDLASRFYTTNVSGAQIVEFAAGVSEMTVVLRLGRKAGALKGHVTDAVTGAPVNPYFEFAWASDCTNKQGVGTRSDYRILLPPNTAIRTTVLSNGYKPWIYPGTISIGSGQDMNLDIQMHPVKHRN